MHEVGLALTVLDAVEKRSAPPPARAIESG